MEKTKRLYVLSLLLLFRNGVFGSHNVTVDNLDPSIVYSGAWNLDSDSSGAFWYDGTVQRTTDYFATARWNFTGVAFYYISPLEDPLPVSITIDDVSFTIGAEDYESLTWPGQGLSVVWGIDGLVDGEHEVVIAVPVGGEVVLDALMYTALDQSDTSASGSGGTPFDIPLPIIIGTSAGCAAVATAITLSLCCTKGRASRAGAASRRLKARRFVMNEVSTKESLLAGYANRSYTTSSTADLPNHLISLHPNSPQHMKVQNMLLNGWKHPEKATPVVHTVFAIVPSQEVLQSYLNYRDEVHASLSKPVSRGNETYLFHGTDRACCIGDDVNNVDLCYSEACFICGIIRNSFDLKKSGSKNNFMRFGAGIYTTACSSKAYDYARNLHHDANYSVLLLNRVVVGRALKKRINDRNLISVPKSYHSIFGVPGRHLNYEETVVYNNDAIRPAYLVAFKT